MADVSLPTQYTSKVARGAASELIASAHLMAQGYHVFRAVASSCPVDLVAYRDNELLRVEVKSGATSPRYNPPFPPLRNLEWDLLVVVLSEATAVTMERRDTIEEVKADYFAQLDRLGLLLIPRGPFVVGDRRFARRTSTSSHLINLARATPFTVCGIPADNWLAANAHALPLCGRCERWAGEAAADPIAMELL